MTIYTTEQLLSQGKKPEDDFDVEIQIDEKKSLNPVEPEDAVYKDLSYPVIVERRHVDKKRRRCCVQLCLFMGMILGLSLCVLGSVFLYRNLYYVKYRGRCGVGLYDLSAYGAMNMSDYDYNEFATPSALKSALGQKQTDLEEEIDIDGSVETLKTPSLYNASAATFRHDFDRNMTAIRDVMSDFCYFVPFLADFSNGMIPTPREFSGFLETKGDDERPMVYEKHEYFERRDPVADSKAMFGGALSEICDGADQWTAEPRTMYDYEYASYPTTQAPVTFSLDSIFRMYPGGADIYTYHIYTFGEDQP